MLKEIKLKINWMANKECYVFSFVFVECRQGPSRKESHDFQFMLGIPVSFFSSVSHWVIQLLWQEMAMMIFDTRSLFFQNKL